MAKKILFIEDEQALQKTLGEILRKEGYEVINALNGEIGLRLVKTEKPDLILLDLILPAVDGFEILKQVKNNPQTKKIPVVVLTNLDKMEDVEKALQAGATNYLLKTDYGLNELIEKIKKIIGE